MSKAKYKIGVIGASGYTGADLIRLALCHPDIEVHALSANTHAGKDIDDVFPHLAGRGLPRLKKADEVDWSACHAVFCGLPHGTAQEVIAAVPHEVRVIDMSADFRLRDPETYASWYNRPHNNLDLLGEAVYGLSEHYRSDIAKARLVACPGCFPTAALLALIPLVKAAQIDPAAIIIDAKSGISGAGRGLKQHTLFCEAGEGVSPYGLKGHRHAPEIDQELSIAAGAQLTVNFTPHLTPMSRGELLTIYVELADRARASDLKATLSQAYADEPFIRIAADGAIPNTQQVRGSNFCVLNVFEDRIPGRAIIISTIDNLVKGSSGQALQNFNIVFDLDETLGLEQMPLFP
jgi:N-acetyl-gamma-glutamyl-phosphate reductase